MDITKLGLDELKAFAYDQLVSIEQSQKNLRIINDEIALRNSQPEVKEEKNGK